MAKKIKKVSVNALERVVNEQCTQDTVVNWFDIEVNIVNTLSLKDMLSFVNDIVNACFLDDGTYIPEIMDFAIKSGILTRYANFTLPNNTEKQYWLIYNSNVVDMVKEHINLDQLQEIIDSATLKIEHMCDMDFVATKAKLEELYNAFANIGTQFGDIFDNISADDIQKVVEAIGTNGVDEEKIVSAYIENTRNNEDDAK